MTEIFPYIFENRWILIVLITPVGCFIWYKIRFKFLTDIILPFGIIGVVLTGLGVVLCNTTVSTAQTINVLMLQELHVAGKLIPIGYIFIIFSLIACVDACLEKAFKTKN
jgi:uncharacterized SAM-binding protein YcdF (DUF218 family)